MASTSWTGIPYQIPIPRIRKNDAATFVKLQGIALSKVGYRENEPFTCVKPAIKRHAVKHNLAFKHLIISHIAEKNLRLLNQITSRKRLKILPRGLKQC